VATTTATPKFTPAGCKFLFDKAYAAGVAAAEAITPVPMIVQDAQTGHVYAPVMDGVCGFAWVNVRPGNSAFARYLKKECGATKGYYGGVNYRVYGYGQSYEKKSAFADAFAAVLSEAGITAYAEGRLD
jgi:hypothetical protein